MNLEPTAEQEELRASVRRFLADATGKPEAVLARGLVDLGVAGLLVPEDCGGAGLGLVEMGVALEEHGRALAGTPLVASGVAATRLLVALRGGEDDAEIARLLRALAAGELVATVALHEASARGDWRAGETRAAASAGGIRLSGRKAPVLAAAAADVFLVAACAVGGALGVYAVERGAPGLRCEPVDCLDASLGLGALDLDAAPARRLGPAAADAALAAAADAAAVALAADALGASLRAVEQSVAYAKQREQFGRPIGSFQAVQHLLVDMLEDVELTRAALQYALWCGDHAPPGERVRAAALAKAHASEALPRVCASAIQVHGGIGFTEELDLHRSYRRACAMQLLFGDASHHFASIADAVLDAGSGA